MQKLESAGSQSSGLARLLHHVARRRNRSVAVAGAALLLLTTAVALWIHGSFAIDTYLVRSQKDQLASSLDHAGAPSPPTQAADQQTSAPMVQGPNAHIPPKIWQISLPKKPKDADIALDPKGLEDTASWIAMNRDYAYTLVGHRGGEQFVQRYFGDDADIVEAYHSIPNVGMKSDFLRYLILGVEGGTYSDTDTVALKPIEHWIPPQFGDQVKLIVGIEYDQRNTSGWVDILHFVQFCQWTIVAAPGHPVFRKMADRVLLSLSELSAIHKVPVNMLQPTSTEVMNSTGPAAWTDVVFEQLQEYNRSLTDTKDLAYMTEPTLYGDVLVLPIDGFGMGQLHSNSTHDGSIPEDALVKHMFHGAWRGQKRGLKAPDASAETKRQKRRRTNPQRRSS